MTRLERIRRMDVDELTGCLLVLQDNAGGYCRMKAECVEALENNTPEIITDEHCKACVRDWLLEEAEC